MVTSLFKKSKDSQLFWYWELSMVLIRRSLKRRYRGSFLGIYWSLLNPLAMTGLYTAIFGATFAQYYGDSKINYVLAAFTGLVVINFSFLLLPLKLWLASWKNGGIVNKIRFTAICVSPIYHWG